MFAHITLLTTAFALPVLSETIHGVLVFTRHGDRTAKYYPGYQMTNLGASQVFVSGQYYRQRFVEENATSRIAGISSDEVVPNQIWATAPDQAVLYQTATNFFQGLYPPLGAVNADLADEELANGTSVQDPLNGYQFILVHGKPETDQDAIWIKGDDSCPAYSRASKSYRQSTEFQDVLERTSDFYSKFEPTLGPIMGAENVTYTHAYDVFDLLNVASIHNSSVDINSDDLDQLRYLANEWEWNHNFNSSEPDRSIGGRALAGGILRALEKTVAAQGARNKFNLMAGSYDTFLAFFGLTNLTEVNSDFYGLPNYAASMAFELVTTTGSVEDPAPFPTNLNDLMVRFSFRNESDVPLVASPLFNRSRDILMPYRTFVDELGSRAINSVGEWCFTCGSTEDFCVAANQTSIASTGVKSSGSGISKAAAGGIGAGVTLAVVIIVAALGWIVVHKKRRSQSNTAEKRVTASDSDSA